MIYIEGTRFSPQKRQRIIRSLATSGNSDALQRAERLTSILPPRPAGALALMRGAPQKDLLFCAHPGFEGSASFAKLFNGGWSRYELSVTRSLCVRARNSNPKAKP